MYGVQETTELIRLEYWLYYARKWKTHLENVEHSLWDV